MSNENTPVDSVSDDLDIFSADFFGQNDAQPEPASSEKTEEVAEESDAPENEDTHPEDDTLEDTEDDDEEEAPEEQPKPKKNRAQERIEELNKKYRETERQLKELQARLEKKEETPLPVEKTDSKEPSPSDLNEDGTDKYPLGEFDPNYIRDYTKYVFHEEKKAIDAERVENEAKSKADELRQTLEENWNEKLGPAQERYPDFQEKGEQMMEAFLDVDPQYGAYLESTLMQLEYGPDVLYYLANNLDEAKKIVNSGATKATIALGRIEAKFAEAAEEKQKARPKVSQAPTPPPTNKGSAVSVAEIPADTDDLDAFESVFFPNKKKKA